MKSSYVRYYEKYTPTANLALVWDALRARSKARKLSLLNRQKDYLRLWGNPQLLALHQTMNRHLYQAATQWGHYDYGEGYFYQGLASIGVRGLRDTDARVEAMRLGELLAGKTVLEIGCNSGFLSLAVAQTARRVVGFDINPHLIEIARAAGEYLGLTNVEFATGPFEDFEAPGRFDAVLSFANHSTYDGNTAQSLERYLERCRDLLAPGGLLLFESHHPEHEGEQLEAVCAMISDLFDVRDRRVLEYGTYLDRGRTFVVAERRPCDRTEVSSATETAPACALAGSFGQQA